MKPCDAPVAHGTILQPTISYVKGLIIVCLSINGIQFCFKTIFIALYADLSQ